MNGLLLAGKELDFYDVDSKVKTQTYEQKEALLYESSRGCSSRVPASPHRRNMLSPANSMNSPLHLGFLPLLTTNPSPLIITFVIKCRKPRRTPWYVVLLRRVVVLARLLHTVWFAIT
ncbi:hypothetical protein B0T09DRAFT_344434 [Sordaria sp. MPI-SDFR-AT-0083]|nr:hypothetical protein B0T09DRAFT_344434 [Sordaria sp. MPI-SDFR-AT-0083]